MKLRINFSIDLSLSAHLPVSPICALARNFCDIFMKLGRLMYRHPMRIPVENVVLLFRSLPIQDLTLKSLYILLY